MRTIVHPLALPIALLLLALPAGAQDARGEGVVANVATHANLRAGPGLGGETIGRLPKGLRVTILEEVASADEGSGAERYPTWYRVRAGDAVGYVAASLIERGPAPLEVPAAGEPSIPASRLDRWAARDRYHPAYRREAERYGVDWRVLKAFAVVESDETAAVVNRFGYTGLFQIGRSALEGFNRGSGTDWTMEDLADPDRNTRVGAWLTGRNRSVLARGGVLGEAFLADPRQAAIALYCAHNYGIGMVKSAVVAHREAGRPMTGPAVFAEVERAGRERYGEEAGRKKMEVARKVGAIVAGLDERLPR